MPIIFVCHSCKKIIAEIGLGKKHTVLKVFKYGKWRYCYFPNYLNDVVDKVWYYLSTCPHCGAKLHEKPLKVEVI